MALPPLPSPQPTLPRARVAGLIAFAAAVGAIGLGAVFFARIWAPPAPPPAGLHTLEPAGSRLLLPSQAESVSPPDLPLSVQSISAIARCEPQARIIGTRTLDDVLDAIARARGGLRDRVESVRITHLRLADGSALRVRVTASPSELRVFGVDAEGLPVPIRIPEEERRAPSDAVIARYLAMGTPTYRETQTHLSFVDGSAADVREEDGHARELQVRGRIGFLGCAAGSGCEYRRSDQR